MKQDALKRAAGEWGTGRIFADSVLLWCFVTFIVLVVAIGAVISFLIWFVSTPILAAIVATRPWRRPRR